MTKLSKPVSLLRKSPPLLSARPSSQVCAVCIDQYTCSLMFSLAFREMDKTWPLYGKHSDPPLSPEEWWTEVIKRTMLHAGAPPTGV